MIFFAHDNLVTIPWEIHSQGYWVHDSQVPVVMMVNSNEFTHITHLSEVTPVHLEVVTCGGRCTRGAALKQIQDIVTRRYVLSVD
jgi:hypothetical protein